MSARIFCVSNPITELLNEPIPEKLWHYTSIEGFHAIVKIKRMWATDARFLNDREELIHVNKIADEVVSAAPLLDVTGFPNKEWLSKAHRLAPLRGLQVFVACFTAAEDQLSQWRAYSHESSGVSLAFDLRSVRPPEEVGSTVGFAPCIYGPPERKKLLVIEALRHFIVAVGDYYKTVYEIACRQDPAKRSLSDKAQVVKEFLDPNPTEKQLPESYVRAVAQTRVNYLQVAALSKNPSRGRWRLVLPMFSEPIPAPENPPQFRAGKTTLIPYVAHPTSKFPLVDVILGPGSDEISVSAAQRFLKSEGLNIKPHLSQVPYRYHSI